MQKIKKRFAFGSFLYRISAHFCYFIDLLMSNKEDKIEVE